MGGRSSVDLDDLARAVADGVPRRVVVGRIAAFMAAFLVGDPELALGAKKRCRKGHRRCGSTCCKPGYVCKKKHNKHHCVCPKPRRACNGRCCASGEHCVSGRCKPVQQQQPEPQPEPTPTPAPTCTDAVQNGNETDVDCGGPNCPACAEGKRCATATDCATGVCTGGVCVAPPPACSADVCGAQHGCPPCANGKTCAAGGDCTSGHCSGGVCVQCASAGDCTSITPAACHEVTCAAGVCGQAAVGAGTACPGGTCDASGSCVAQTPQCTTAADCGTDTTCTSYTCTSGTCGTFVASAGTPAGSTCTNGTQANYVCDGHGNSVQESTVDCGAYLCSNNTCLTSCSAPTDCDATHTCVNGDCVPKCTINAPCPVPNGTGMCNAQGICEVAGCNQGFLDCDGNPANGCEFMGTTCP